MYKDFSPVAGDIWPKIKLTTAHAKPWEETRAAALWVLPYITDVWYAMMVDRNGETAWFTDKIETAATDDKYMYINPVFLFGHPLEERVFICAHEVLHCIFNHCGLMYALGKEGKVRYSDGDVLPYIHKLMNIAMDCLINAMLVDADVGGKPDSAWYLPEIIDGNMNALEAYRILYKRWKQPGKRPCKSDDDKEGSDGMEIILIPSDETGQSFDIHLEPGQGRGLSPAQAEAERNPQEWDDAVMSAMQSARAAGRLPGNMERIFKLNMEVPTPWQDLMMISVSQGIGREGHSWAHLDGEFAIRGIGFPSRVRHGCNCAVVVADTSGSINQQTMNMFMSNIAVILSQVHPKELWFCDCDTQIYNWGLLDNVYDLESKVRGGGGTSFHPPFQKVEEEGLTPEILIYFTDLECWGAFPDDPGYPVIWACIIPEVSAPYGTTIYVPPLKEDPETL